MLTMVKSSRTDPLKRLTSTGAGDVSAIPEINPYRPEEFREESFYSPMLQGTGTNRFTQISTRKSTPAVDAITGLATITSGSLKVFIERYNALEGGLRVSTHKLLDACTIALTAQNDYRGSGDLRTLVVIPLEDYMARCGIPLTKPSKDKTRRRIKQDLETLYSTSIEWSEPRGEETCDFSKMRICTMVAVKNGKIMMDFSPAIASYLTNAYIMQYPLELFKADERNPSAYYIGKKLLQHFSFDNNQRRGTSNIISIRALLDACPDIPSYQEVMKADRHLDQRIIAPFENAIGSLSSFIRWEYCNGKGVALSEEQLQSFTYATFVKCFIKFEVLHAPDLSCRLDGKKGSPRVRKRKKSESE